MPFELSDYRQKTEFVDVQIGDDADSVVTLELRPSAITSDWHENTARFGAQIARIQQGLQKADQAGEDIPQALENGLTIMHEALAGQADNLVVPVVSWDLVDDGTPVPVTGDGWRSLPHPLQVKLAEAVSTFGQVDPTKRDDSSSSQD